MRFSPCTPRDLRLIEPQDAQRAAHLMMQSWDDETLRTFLTEGESWVAHDGIAIIAVGGISLLHHGRGNAWMVVSWHCTRRHLLTLTRWMRSYLDQLQSNNPAYNRIEATVRVNDAYRHDRWPQMLGFEAEGVLRAFDIEQQDHTMYSRVHTWPIPSH